MAVRQFQLTFYRFICSTTENEENETEEKLINCIGSEEFTDKNEAFEQGWAILNGIVYCKHCCKLINKIDIS